MTVESTLEKLLEKEHFVVTAELGPPQSASAGAVRKKTRHFKGYVDAVNITDNQTAIVRMSSIATAVVLIEEGLEPVIQMTCRDRNRIAIQSDILGASALGIRNLLCLSGDHQKFGNHPGAKNVYDIDSIQLLSVVKAMRDEAKFSSGDEIKTPPKMFIGAAANPFADPFEFRVIRLAKKVEAGAGFIQTQAVFDISRLKEYMKSVRESGIDKQTAILAGIIPVRSVKALEYMKNQVAGMMIPDELVKRMRDAKEPKDEGIKIALELIAEVKEIPGIRGVHLMPVMWESAVPVLCESAGLLPRPSLS
jgi:methylenetetrahydrofolate reductase (NADPH)